MSMSFPGEDLLHFASVGGRHIPGADGTGNISILALLDKAFRDFVYRRWFKECAGARRR
jgi:hypothetical protein